MCSFKVTYDANENMKQRERETVNRETSMRSDNAMKSRVKNNIEKNARGMRR